MSGTATGSSADFGAGVELRPTQPQQGRMRQYIMLPSVDVQGKDETTDPSKVSLGTGKAEGVPGKISGTFDVGLRTAPGTWVPWLAFFAGGAITKSEPETGVYRYAFDAVRTSDLVSAPTFSAVLGRNPVDTVRRDGIAPTELTAASGNNTEVATRIKGFSTHGCKFGFARADGANTGGYPYQPILRGIAASDAQSIHLRVTSKAPLRIRLEQADTPTWAGFELDLSASYTDDGYAVWEVARGADRAHLGVVQGNNWNPMEVVMPGTLADHALLEVGDTWTFDRPGAWRVRDLALPSGDADTYEKTSAAFDLVVWEYGQTQKFRVQGANNIDLNLTSGAEPDDGTGSRAAFSILREQPIGYSIGINRKLASKFFLDGSERQRRYGTELTLRGPDIGTSHTYQDSVRIVAPYNAIKDYSAPVPSVATIVEGFALDARESPDGSPAISVEITTEADYDVASLTYI